MLSRGGCIRTSHPTIGSSDGLAFAADPKHAISADLLGVSGILPHTWVSRRVLARSRFPRITGADRAFWAGGAQRYTRFVRSGGDLVRGVVHRCCSRCGVLLWAREHAESVHTAQAVRDRSDCSRARRSWEASPSDWRIRKAHVFVSCRDRPEDGHGVPGTWASPVGDERIAEWRDRRSRRRVRRRRCSVSRSRLPTFGARPRSARDHACDVTQPDGAANCRSARCLWVHRRTLGCRVGCLLDRGSLA